MCGTSKSTSTTTIPPELMQAYQGVVNAGQNFYTNVTPQNYSNDPNSFVAPLNQTQLTGIAGTNTAANQAQPYYQNATNQLNSAYNTGMQNMDGSYGDLFSGLNQGQAGNSAAYGTINNSMYDARNINNGALGGLGNAAMLGYAGNNTAGNTIYGAQNMALGTGADAFNTQYQGMLEGKGNTASANNTLFNAYAGVQPLQQQAINNMAQSYYGAQGYNQRADQQYQQSLNQADPLNQAAIMQYAQGLSAASPVNYQALSQIDQSLSGAQPYQQQAARLAQAGMQGVSANQIGGRQIDQFMSPYISSVLQGTQGMLNQQNQQAMSGQTGNAIRQGAFGGDRAGIAAASLAQQQRLADAQIYSGILNQGYGQALGAAQQQQGINLSAEQANRAAIQQGSQAVLGIGQQGFGQGMTTAQQQAAMAQQLYAQQAGAGQNLAQIGQQIYGQRAGAGQNLAGLGQQQYGQGMGLSQAQLGAGQQQYAQGAQTAQQEAANAKQMYDMTAATAAHQQELAKMQFDFGSKTAAQQAALAQQGYTMGSDTAMNQANIGNMQFGQGATTAQQQAALAQQVFGMQSQASQQRAALAQQQYGMGSNTSQQMAALGAGRQNSALQGAQAQLQAGQVQQQTQQAALQAMYNQWYQTNYGLPMQLLNTYAGAVTGIGQNMGTSTETRKPAGLFDFLSDERAKENITPIGKTNDGQTIHRYNYKGDPRTQIGLIAQEVEKHHPDAVGLAGGLKTVNYDKATEDSVRAKRYAGGIVNSQGGAVSPMQAGQGFADGGVPMYDPNAMTGLLSSHQGMYAQGLGGSGPVAAPNFAGMGYTPAMPVSRSGVSGSNQAPVDQPHQDNFAEATAKAAVKTAADEEGKKLWNQYAKEPIANAMKPVTNAMAPINSSIDHTMTSMFGPKPIGSEIGNISGPMAGGSEISAAPDLTGLSGAPNPVLNAPQISTPGLAGAGGPPPPAMGGPVAPPVAATGTAPLASAATTAGGTGAGAGLAGAVHGGTAAAATPLADAAIADAATAAAGSAAAAAAAEAAAAAAATAAAAAPAAAAMLLLATGGSARRRRATGGLAASENPILDKLMSRANAIDDVEAPEDDMDAIANNDVVRFPFSTPGGAPAGASSGLGAALPAAQKAAPERARPAASTMPSDLASVMPLIGKAEGRGKNPLSSATGPFQIINDNFVNLFRQTQPDRAKAMSKTDILNLRGTPEGDNLSRQFAPILAQENVAALKNHGLPVTPGNIYLTWFLGPRYGVKTLQSHPNTPIEQIVPESFIAANKSVLQGKTAAQVANWTADRLEAMKPKAPAGLAGANGFNRGGYATDGSTDDDPNTMDLIDSKDVDGGVISPDIAGSVPATGLNPPAPVATNAAPGTQAPAKPEPSMIQSVEHFGSNLWKGAKKGLEGYGEGLAEGNEKQWVPLLSGIVGAATAPTNGLGNALVYGLGTGVKTYQAQRQFGLEGQKIVNEANRVAASADSARLAGAQAALNAATAAFVDLSGQTGNLPPEHAKDGRTWYYPPTGQYMTPAERSQFLAQKWDESSKRQIGTLNPSPLSLGAVGGSHGSQASPLPAGMPAVPQQPVAMPPAAVKPVAAQPPVATAPSVAKDPLASYRLGSQPTIQGLGIDESAVPVASRYSALMESANASRRAGNPAQADALMKQAQDTLAPTSPYANVYSPFITAQTAYKAKQQMGQNAYVGEAQNMSGFNQAAAEAENLLNNIAEARSRTNANTLAATEAGLIGKARSIPFIGESIVPEAGKNFQNDVVVMDKAASQLSLKQAAMEKMLSRAPAAAIGAERPASITSEKPPTAAYEMMATQKANILQGRAWANEVQRLGGQDIDWNAYKNDWFQQHPISNYTNAAAKTLPFSNGMSNADKVKYVDKTTQTFGGKPATVYLPANKGQLDALPPNAYYKTRDGQYRRKAG